MPVWDDPSPPHGRAPVTERSGWLEL